MVTLVFSPRGIPASYRHDAGLRRQHLQVGQRAPATPCSSSTTGIPKQGVEAWTEDDAAAEQGRGARLSTRKDLYDAIERGDFPEWELHVQIMEDDEHPELDFDPLDDTKVWPEERVPAAAGRPDGARPQRRRTSSPRTSRSRSAPACSSTGSTSPTTRCSSGGRSPTRDTQRYRVGPNYLQLPINQPKNGRVATNQRDGADGLLRRRRRREPARQLRAVDHGRAARGARRRRTTSRGRSIDGPPHAQADRAHQRLRAGRRALSALGAVGARRPRREPRRRYSPSATARSRSAWSGTCCMCEDELGARVGDGLGISADDVRGLEPLPTQTLSEDDLQRSRTSARTPRARSRAS